MSGYSLDLIYLYLSGSCNLNCLHCWSDAENTESSPKAGKMEFGALRQALIEAAGAGLSRVVITGGEPFLCDYTLDLIKWLKKKSINAAVETNATLIDKETAVLLKDSQVNQVSVSLDGSNSKIHQRLRRTAGSFKRAVKGIDSLVKAGLKTEIIFSLWKGNAQDIEKTLKLACSCGADGFKINPVGFISRGWDMRSCGQLLEIGRILDLKNKIMEIKKRYGIKVSFDLPAAFFSLSEVKKLQYCNIKNILGITPDGAVSICGIGRSIEDLVLGNIAEDNLSLLWNRSETLNEVRRCIPEKLEGVCGKCIFKFKCLGKCRAAAYWSSKSLYAPYPFCQEAYENNLFPERALLST